MDENLVGVIDTKLDITTPLRASQGILRFREYLCN